MSIGVNWLDAAAQVGANATMNGQETALVLFSGGQDSAVCLAYALQNHGRVETLGFDYGQTHKVELTCRAKLREGLAALNPAWGRPAGR